MSPIALTIEDAVKSSGLARSRLYLLMGTQAIEHRKIGRRTMILTKSLEDFILSQPPAAIKPPRGGKHG